MPKMKEIRKVVQKLSREQESVTGGGGGGGTGGTGGAGAGGEPVQKYKVTPGILGCLNKML